MPINIDIVNKEKKNSNESNKTESWNACFLRYVYLCTAQWIISRKKWIKERKKKVLRGALACRQIKYNMVH